MTTLPIGAFHVDLTSPDALLPLGYDVPIEGNRRIYFVVKSTKKVSNRIYSGLYLKTFYETEDRLKRIAD